MSVPLEFMLTASGNSLSNFQLARLNESANLYLHRHLFLQNSGVLLRYSQNSAGTSVLLLRTARPETLGTGVTRTGRDFPGTSCGGKAVAWRTIRNGVPGEEGGVGHGFSPTTGAMVLNRCEYSWSSWRSIADRKGRRTAQHARQRQTFSPPSG